MTNYRPHTWFAWRPVRLTVMVMSADKPGELAWGTNVCRWLSPYTNSWVYEPIERLAHYKTHWDNSL